MEQHMYVQLRTGCKMQASPLLCERLAQYGRLALSAACSLGVDLYRSSATLQVTTGTLGT